MKHFFLVLMITGTVIAGLPAKNTDDKRLIYESSLLGFGLSSIYDSYLSPVDYSGFNITAISETMRTPFRKNNHFVEQYSTDISYQIALNNTGSATQQAGVLNSDYTLFYKFNTGRQTPLSLMLGLQADGLLGFLYNDRNSNNPVALKLHFGLGASAMIAYGFDVAGIYCRLRGQVSAPFAGTMYAPEFGQSYYEISLDASSQLFYFSSFNNYLKFKTLLSAEISIGYSTLRLSYLNYYYQTTINSLNSRISFNTFLLGLSRNILPVSTKQIKNYRQVFD